jgi:hypothetical protein
VEDIRGAKDPREGARERAGCALAGLRQAESFGQEKKGGGTCLSQKRRVKRIKQSILNPRLDSCVRKVRSAEKKRWERKRGLMELSFTFNDQSAVHGVIT